MYRVSTLVLCCAFCLIAYLVQPGTGLSALSTMLRLYVRQPGGWFYHIEQMQRINYQKIAINITHQNSCQVVCFFIGPGDYRLLQHADIQYYLSFIICQVVWKFRNVASEHINIVKRRKTSLPSYQKLLSTNIEVGTASDHGHGNNCYFAVIILRSFWTASISSYPPVWRATSKMSVLNDSLFFRHNIVPICSTNL